MNEEHIATAIGAALEYPTVAGASAPGGPVITWLKAILAYLASLGLDWPTILAKIGQILPLLVAAIATGDWVGFVAAVLKLFGIPTPPIPIPAKP